jgi:hypothetical protein
MLARLVAMTVLLALASCDNPPAGGGDAGLGVGGESESPSLPQEQTPQDLWGRRFVSVSILPDGQSSLPAAATPISVRFELRDNAGVLMWERCNSWGSKVRIDPQRLKVLTNRYYNLDVSEQGCSAYPSEERWLARFFLADPYWALDGNRLTLSSGETTIELEEPA